MDNNENRIVNQSELVVSEKRPSQSKSFYRHREEYILDKKINALDRYINKLESVLRVQEKKYNRIYKGNLKFMWPSILIGYPAIYIIFGFFKGVYLTLGYSLVLLPIELVIGTLMIKAENKVNNTKAELGEVNEIRNNAYEALKTMVKERISEPIEIDKSTVEKKEYYPSWLYHKETTLDEKRLSKRVRKRKRALPTRTVEEENM